jgi:hypothetical protein
MKREKFLQDAKREPSRFYRNPSDIIRDRRLSNEDRIEILDAWARNIEDDDGMMRDELHRLRDQVENGTEPHTQRLRAAQ